MRYLIYGAGGVGGVIGARLFQHGHEVVLIGRGEHLAAIQREGLRLQTPEGTEQLRLAAVGHPSELTFRDDDVVLLTVKTQDSVAALDDLRRAGGDALPVICAQNGVENERLAARRFRRVYGMSVWLPATLLEPGLVLNYATPVSGVLDAGRYPEGVDGTVEALTAGLDGSGFSSRAEPRVMRWKYAKLLWNLQTAITALSGVGSKSPALQEGLRAEAIACYEAAGIDYASEAEEERRWQECGFEMVEIEGRPPRTGSAWQSLQRGQGSIETDYVNGEIVLLGARYGLATPCNRALQRAANQLAWRGAPPGGVPLAELERLVHEEQASAAARPG